MPPHVILKPQIFKDGDQWCVLYGQNIQEGIAGFGLSQSEACANFDKAWHESKRTHNPDERG